MKAIICTILFWLVTINISAQIVDGGAGHSLLLCKNGEVFSVGENSYGQLGDSTLDTSWVYSRVPGLVDVAEVEAGCWHSMVLKRDGSVWMWGGNDFAQLVDGTATNRFQPQKVDSLDKVTQISAGWWHSLFLMEDSTVWGGGANGSGELGVNQPPYVVHRPHKIPGLQKVIKVAGGYDYSLVLKVDGTVWAFGENTRGQLGNGQNVASTTPVNVILLTGIIDVAAGWSSSYAIKSDGSLWAWGSNRVGQLGTGAPMGTSEFSSQPVQVNSLDSILMIKTESYSTIALRYDGTVWAWGDNSSGQLGDGTFLNRNSPVQVQGLSNIVAIGMASGVGTAIDDFGNVFTWGGVSFTLASDTITQKLVPSLISPIACNPVISLQENEENEALIELYPNPTKGSISFQTTTGSTIERMEIYNSTGILLVKENLPKDSLDITGLAKGVYFIKFQVDGQILVKKILKE